MYNITFDGQKRKPAPMLMYNVYKKGVDKGNQMLAHNSVHRASRRRTYRIFCNYLNIAALNSWVIVRHNNTSLQYPVRKSGRRRMLRELALQLGEDCMHIKSQINNLSRQIPNDFPFKTIIIKLVSNYSYVMVAHSFCAVLYLYYLFLYLEKN